MSTRARLQNANDSKSLWNYTLSPGWSAFDAHILRLAIMRYGCGAWRNINRHFPLKTCGQLNLQTQRLFGQQALAEFQKVHVDPNRIKQINDKIDGFRKNTCLINTGNNLTAEEKENRRQEHMKKYGIPKELYQKIKVPVVLDPPTPCDTVIDDIEKLREMYRCVYDIQLRLKHLKENKGNNAANIALRANKAKKLKNGDNKSNDSNTNNNDNNNNNNNNNKNKSIDNTNRNNNKSASKPNVREDSKDMDEEDIEMMDKNKNKKNEEPMTEVAMDEDVAMAMALSMSMQAANIDTPKPGKKTKKQKSKKKNTSNKKKNASSTKKRGKKRKKMESDADESYVPPPAKKRVKRK